MIVLAAAALLVRSAVNLHRTAVGFDPFNRVLEQVSSAPGIEHAALDSRPPLGSNGFVPEDKELRLEHLIDSTSHFVSADYSQCCAYSCAPQDVCRAPLVMIVNETLGRRAFGDVNNAIGKRISCCEGTPEDAI